MTKHYTKPSVKQGEWNLVVSRLVGMTYIEIYEQFVDGTYQDHYAIYIDGKRQRPTFFGEMAYHDVKRAFNNLVGWPNMITEF